MGRREDGAAVGRGGDVPSTSPGRRREKSPPSIDAAPRASGKRIPTRSGDGGAPLAGTRTCRQELADRRGWSTFSKARPVPIAKRRKWCAGRRLVPIARDEETPSHGVSGCLADRPGARSQALRVCRRSAPLGSAGCRCERGPARGRPNNTGDDACLPLPYPEAPACESTRASKNL